MTTRLKLTSNEKFHIAGITLLFLSIVLMALAYEKVKKERKQYESLVGKTIILGRDTLTITNYDEGKEVYNLSNRVIIDKEYVMLHAN